MRTSRAFTLIEMLVVTGIIATLVALMSPMLHSARQASSRVRCMSNLKQLAACVTSYTMDNDGQIPYCNWANSVDAGGFYGNGWLFAMPPYRVSYPTNSDLNGNWLSQRHPPADGMMTGQLWQYCKTQEIYHCPLDDPDFRAGTEWMTSYLMNGAQCGYGRIVNLPGVRMATIRQPSDSVMFWEGLEQMYQNQQLTGAVWNDGSSYPSEEVLADRHFKGANVACFDGHVEWWNRDTWVNCVNAPGFGRLWCDPLSSDGR